MLGAWIKQQREAQNPRWTQDDLASRLNITQAQVSRLEKGDRRPTPEMIHALAKLFDVSPTDIFRMAWPGGATAFDTLQGEGIPSTVLEELQQLEPGLTSEDWSAMLDLARLMARKNARQPQQGRGRSVQPAQPEGEPDTAQSGPNERISARGRLRRAHI